MQSLRLWLRQTRARAALALAAHAPTSAEELLAVARAEARAIARERTRGVQDPARFAALLAPGPR